MLIHALTVERAKRVECDRGENPAADTGAAEQLHPPGDGDGKFVVPPRR